MADDLGTYVIVLLLGTASALVVGQVLLRTGHAVLEEAFPDRRVARSVNRLLGVLYHLGALGLIALISVVDVPVSGTAQTVITKLGIVLLVLGAAHGLVMFVLSRIKSRRREQDALDRMSVLYPNTRPPVPPRTTVEDRPTTGTPPNTTPPGAPVFGTARKPVP